MTTRTNKLLTDLYKEQNQLANNNHAERDLIIVQLQTTSNEKETGMPQLLFHIFTDHNLCDRDFSNIVGEHHIVVFDEKPVHLVLRPTSNARYLKLGRYFYYG